MAVGVAQRLPRLVAWLRAASHSLGFATLAAAAARLGTVALAAASRSVLQGCALQLLLLSCTWGTTRQAPVAPSRATHPATSESTRAPAPVLWTRTGEDVITRHQCFWTAAWLDGLRWCAAVAAAGAMG
eukprot:COSAG02_NODE_3809_length_6200_cov_16.371415_1_plen_129_part_00